MSPEWSAGLAVLAIVAIVMLMYNRLVKLRNRAENAWADLDVHLTRRHELIPNLVEVVKGYAAHEQQTFDAVLRARSTGMAATDPDALTEAETQVASQVERLLMVAEAYPDLKADGRFRDLQIELAATEDKIAFSRQLYNDVVTSFATTTQSIPWVALAGPLGFQAPPLYAAEDPERTQVRVAFDSGGSDDQSGGQPGDPTTEG